MGARTRGCPPSGEMEGSECAKSGQRCAHKWAPGHAYTAEWGLVANRNRGLGGNITHRVGNLWLCRCRRCSGAMQLQSPSVVGLENLADDVQGELATTFCAMAGQMQQCTCARLI